MANTIHLYKVGNTYYFRCRIPKDLRVWFKDIAPAQKFWFHILETEMLNNSGWGSGEVDTELFCEKYLKYVSNMGIKHKSALNELGMELAKMFPADKFEKKRKGSSANRRYKYIFPSLAESRECFEQFINQKIDWPVDEE